MAVRYSEWNGKGVGEKTKPLGEGKGQCNKDKMGKRILSLAAATLPTQNHVVILLGVIVKP